MKSRQGWEHTGRRANAKHTSDGAYFRRGEINDTSYERRPEEASDTSMLASVGRVAAAQHVPHLASALDGEANCTVRMG